MDKPKVGETMEAGIAREKRNNMAKPAA
jgi:hypothetical protein